LTPNQARYRCPEYAADENRANATDRDADERMRQAPFQDLPADRSRRRAESHADADLPRAQLHEIGNDPVEAHRRQRTRERGEGGHHV
jgi:hypothetical protein